MWGILKKINSNLRKAVIFIGTIAIIFKLTEKKKEAEATEKYGFQEEEFDDIW